MTAIKNMCLVTASHLDILFIFFAPSRNICLVCFPPNMLSNFDYRAEE